ncbi:MAG TPA: hypothetical protein DD623_02420 [Streptococcus sp.]|uniref:Uncharacterized protein n=2 Tax=Streptococcus TaxID=1301 RepID=A0A6L8MX02_STRSU|nr:hypothetical protein [Streptococcus suis]NCB80157.1 hypothetical protein [Bacilli bacterium]TAA12809.1 hypothetical protein EXW74_05940 [Streptococcus parasuis]ULL21927.1 hypothetical protein D2A30_10410 [Streptococcus suis]HBO88503.1 hypothetical protein [Streptococcus sp.]
MCEITAGQNEARQQKVSKKSNRCCFDEGLLHESGLLKTLFPTIIIILGGHNKCHVIQDHLGNKLVVLACH